MVRFLLLPLLALALIAAGDPEKKRTRGIAAGRAEVRANVEKLTTQIQWRTSMDKALVDARAEGKLVLWLHLLGRLDGVT
jgi:hypothetical protein